MLYEKYAPVMRGICSRYAHESDETSDILQEGFIKVFSKIDQYRSEGSFEGWMKRIFVNTAISHFHKNKKYYYHSDIEEDRDRLQHENENPEIENEIDIEDIDPLKVDYTLVEKADFSEQELLEALNTVPEHFRVVFNLFAIDDCSHKEIADVLGIEEKTSRTRLLRAKKILQETLYKMSIEKLGK